MKNYLIYLKTTETCNLNCLHCFTSGSSGAKIFWNPEKITDWLRRFNQETQDADHVHLELHGGEPFLVDSSTIFEVYQKSKNLWKNQSWGMTSNLVFKLTDDKIDIISKILKNRIGTSWDPDIRFNNPKQYDLWRSNVKKLLELGVEIKLFISLTKGTLKIEPIDLLEWTKDLGITELALERLTFNGSAKKNKDIFPSNIELDRWFLKMHEQSTKYNARSWLDNVFLESVYSKFESRSINQGTFCRDCEEKLFTINADGSIAGCPNSAPEDYFGNISDNIKDLFKNPKRLHNIACERARDPRCYSCEVFEYCNSDCHQIEWQENICGAPKSLMKILSKPDKKIIPIKSIDKYAKGDIVCQL